MSDVEITGLILDGLLLGFVIAMSMDRWITCHD